MSARRIDQLNVRTSLGPEAIAEALVDNLRYLQAKLPQHATRNDWCMALAYTVRDRMLDRYTRTVEAISGASPAAKVVAYLSAEFLTGPHLGNSRRCLDTALASPDDFCPWEKAPFVRQGSYVVAPRSVVVLVLPLHRASEAVSHAVSQ